jgi:hypothetical protein
MLMVAVVGTAAAAAGINVRASYGAQVTGDEPQYLLTAMSLGEDLSLDVSDEIRNRRYLPFHEIPIDPQSRPLDARGKLISPHDPLLPALLALPMRAGGWTAAKWALALTAGALAAAILWVAVRRFGVGLATATTTAAVFAASSPFAVYGNQVYPEIPAALFTTIGIAALTGRLRRAGAVVLWASVVALPNLSVKYVPVAAALAAIGLLRLWRADRRIHALILAAAFAVAGGLFAAAHLAWYGGLTPYAVGDHFTAGEFTVVGAAPNFPGRSVRLVGLLLDREFGIAAWQPAWLLAVPAVAALAHARPPRWETLVVPLAVGWLTATFVALTMHGWWWPGRQTVVVLPAATLAISWWADGSRARRVSVALTGLVGIVTLGWFVADGLARRVTTVVDFFKTTAPTYEIWSRALPAYRAGGTATWILHAAWLAVVGALAWWGWKRSAARRPAGASSLRDGGARDAFGRAISP